MAKPTLVCSPQWEFIGAKLASHWVPHFTHQYLQPNRVYRPDQHVMCFDYQDADTATVQAYQDQGFKIIINHLWDSYICEETNIVDNVLTLHSKNWMWINENFIYNQRGYRSQIAQSDPTKFFLLLMNMVRSHREQLFEQVQPFLPHSLYSYVKRGHYIADDAPMSTAEDTGGFANQWLTDDRYSNPAWYSTTNFSLVVETTLGIIRDPALCPPPGQRLFISEKSFKPFAFQHPFVTYGTPYTLQFLQDSGFETFGHVIDESYDSIYDDQLRLQAIQAELERLYTEFTAGRPLFQDPTSQAKLQHNFERFYDTARVKQMWLNEVVEPVQQFINS